jgi:hypothetical protein
MVTLKTILYTYCVLFLLLVSCSSHPKTHPVTKKQPRHAKFLNKFKSISFDTLQVHSPDWNRNDKYYGIPLDSVDVTLFPLSMAKEHSIAYPTLFACYKFPLEGNKYGLIVRAPAMYSSTSIKLFIFDLNVGKLKESVELADLWIDAGDTIEKISWLFKEQEKIKAFTWIRESHDNDVESLADTTVDRWDYYYLLSISSGTDTLSKDSLNLTTQFKHLFP